MSDWWQGKMETITEDTVLAEFNKTPRRRCVRDTSGLSDYQNKFWVPFMCQKRIFEKQTGLFLEYEAHEKNYVKSEISEKELSIIERWIQDQGSLIFLRNCLALSIALDFNFVEGKASEYTSIGSLVHRGKNNPNNKNIVEQLSSLATEKINTLPFYKDVDFVCAIPSRKPVDLPGQVTALVSEKIGKPNITEGFIFGKEKEAVKNSKLGAKWDAWKKSEISFKAVGAFDVKGKSVVLLDDVYQSGRTIQYVAMKLQEAGVRQICGLSLVKTWGDKDNTSFKK